ncbi:hypothetical protein FC83_GL000899 [Agrilactobacillus composti DSM 18527 = JCM 14202]|uniref:Uncharacterized protein n=1 Tax=Agrilactobacillus composti DSM 18527 = JCM 14202 TaxID=1423734 RepID=X0PT26_9LACO|nr:hypothetical protein [Agrilactobacillus composti]KRM35596.1 hypothetical protein FC83_GL000899 [Agrilactobacillus composti DSM 18527 = JCM 14202]GAF41112.1 hypothetical protein JCM14202_3036 [Agrilactobacillus composti DSM 18527 = JCM 14202]
MQQYYFSTDIDGNITGHTDPEFASKQTGGVLIAPDPAWIPNDDINWKIIERAGVKVMVKKDNNQSSFDENLMAITQTMNSVAAAQVENQQVQKVLTNVMNGQAQTQATVTALMNTIAANQSNEGKS